MHWRGGLEPQGIVALAVEGETCAIAQPQPTKLSTAENPAFHF